MSRLTTPESRLDRRETPRDCAQSEFLLAIDFGTTYTSITFVKRTSKNEHILGVERFPGDRCLGRTGTQVPTEAVYLKSKRPKASNIFQQSEEVYKEGYKSQGPAVRTRQSRKRSMPASASLYKYIYGYEVHRFSELPESDMERREYEAPLHVRRMKLLLDKSAHVENTRKELRSILDQLILDGRIENDEDVIRDFLVSVLHHCKSELKMDHGFHDRSSVEVVFCVPVCWNLEAHASMSRCVMAAMKRTRFGVTKSSPVPNLFMVSEAEAAALNALSSGFHDLKRNEVFLLVDCGGGTTDLGLYRVARSFPLRLGTELSNPTGAAVGATDLNERLREVALSHLKQEHYLCNTEDDTTILSIIENDIMPLFENEFKRAFNLSNTSQRFVFRIRGLRESSSNHNVQRGAFVLSYDDMLRIFEPSLRAIYRLVKTQVHMAVVSGTETDKVVLVGGFEYLKRKIDSLNGKLKTNIRLLTTPPNTGATGVAMGAIMRAQDKRYGSERVSRMSYGIMRHLEWDPDSDLDYMCDQLAEKSADDGVYEIRETIKWLIKANKGPLKSEHRVTFESVHIFYPSEEEWDAEEILFVSESCTEDHYRLNHHKNDGKVDKLGQIEFDLSHLKGRIPLTEPEKGRPHYKVTVLIEMVVIDRNLKFFVRWPANEDGGIIKGSQESFSMVAAFQPGTA